MSLKKKRRCGVEREREAEWKRERAKERERKQAPPQLPPSKQAHRWSSRWLWRWLRLRPRGRGMWAASVRAQVGQNRIPNLSSKQRRVIRTANVESLARKDNQTDREREREREKEQHTAL